MNNGNLYGNLINNYDDDDADDWDDLWTTENIIEKNE